MRILLLADLHFRVEWYHWLAQQRVDIAVIAGDLLDGFHPEGLLPQMLSFREWCARFPGNLALSSGNHDANEPGGAVDPQGLAEIRDEMWQALSKCYWPSTGWTLWSGPGLSPMAGRRLSKPLAALW